MNLSVNKVWAISPAGDLATLDSRLKNNEKLRVDDFQGQCDPDRIKELNSLMAGTILRRMPRLAKLALRAAWEVRPLNETNSGLIIVTAYASVGSTFEFLDSLINDGAALASPTAFSHSVTNMSAAYVSQHLNLKGPSLTLTRDSFPESLEAAEALITSGQAADLLLGVIAEASATMAEIEKTAEHIMPPPHDGAVFFHLTGASQAGGETVIEYQSPCPESAELVSQDPLAFLGASSALALALRLALACHQTAGEGKDNPLQVDCGPARGSIIVKKSETAFE